MSYAVVVLLVGIGYASDVTLCLTGKAWVRSGPSRGRVKRLKMATGYMHNFSLSHSLSLSRSQSLSLPLCVYVCGLWPYRVFVRATASPFIVENILFCISPCICPCPCICLQLPLFLSFLNAIEGDDFISISICLSLDPLPLELCLLLYLSRCLCLGHCLCICLCLCP